MRDAEIFAYRVLSRPDTAGMEHLVIAQAERESSRPAFLEVEISLTEFLQREMESGKRDSDKVMLTPTAALRPWNVRATEAWQIEAIDVTSGYIKLARPSDTSFGRSPAPETGYVRTKGHFSAITLIERRKRAIDRLPDHSYLLRALAQPGMVYMDTGPTKLPFPLSPEVVDASKEAIISDVLRVRPLYALQGPPGTGKTTLVSHLLREILEEDPVAQILVTSQGHGAVDVLRRKVLDEAFSGVPPAQMPLAVRLGTRESADVTVDGGLNETVRELLTNVQAQVSADSDLTRAWRALVHEMLSAEDGVDAKSRRCLSDFRELVKRSASITYCTTSAQDLEALADGQQSFDWAVVEEAGKCHGFDLALPLQAGHRWLLLGDHKQLPPYRYKDFRDAISDLDNCAAAILGLPSRDLVDLDWWRDWRDRGASEKQEFQAYCQRWLRTFAQLYEQQKLAADGATRQTLLESIGASAGLLSKQYRMHPDIGTLISETFYDRTVTNATLDDAGMPLDAVLHGLSSPGYVSKKAICWLDTPDCMIDARAEEIGPSQGRPRFTNPTEVNAVVEFLSNLKPQSRTDEPLEVAILAPYTQQVLLLNERLKEYTLPPGFRFRRALSVNTSGIPSQRPAHTVDSFQGNEADIVLVSLVRNNSKLAQDPTALGFLDQADRVNVLLSRAQRLLVMVGSFSFFERQVRLVPIDNPNAYIWHWKKVLTFVEQLVVSDRASRVSLTIDRST
ncbi:MAG TPA: AAA domain-containing protein [Nevskiaceae bacterium]|nr:AAA domain-containing protein [Nevskiaceae bacterium]